MTDALLMHYVDIEIPDHDDATVGADALLAAGELAALHVALHDVHAVLLIERDAGDLVEADDVVLTHESTLAVGVVHEHARHGRLAAAHQVRVGRYLLEEMALAGPTRAQLHRVVVPLYERHHTEERDVAGA